MNLLGPLYGPDVGFEDVSRVEKLVDRCEDAVEDLIT
jgi:hypothetical protein